jgi:uncharacterized protein
MSTTLHLVELDSVPPQPWRNGGGQTRELLAWPAGSGVGWQLRVSVADIDCNGPFSPFPQVERWFAVLEGSGVALRFAGREMLATPASAPVHFDGAAAPDCRLLAGSTRDLNLMVRQGAGVAVMRVAQTGDSLGGDGLSWCGVYAASALILTLGDGRQQALPAASFAWCDAPQGTWRLHPAPSTSLRAWWLQLQAHG